MILWRFKRKLLCLSDSFTGRKILNFCQPIRIAQLEITNNITGNVYCKHSLLFVMTTVLDCYNCAYMKENYYKIPFLYLTIHLNQYFSVFKTGQAEIHIRMTLPHASRGHFTTAILTGSLDCLYHFLFCLPGFSSIFFL